VGRFRAPAGLIDPARSLLIRNTAVKGGGAERRRTTAVDQQHDSGRRRVDTDANVELRIELPYSLLAPGETYRRMRELRGKMRVSIDLEALREDRE
jgi:hypothetical protein